MDRKSLEFDGSLEGYTCESCVYASILFSENIPALKLTAKAPENLPSQKETSLPIIPFSGAMLVSGSVLRFTMTCAYVLSST